MRTPRQSAISVNPTFFDYRCGTCGSAMRCIGAGPLVTWSVMTELTTGRTVRTAWVPAECTNSLRCPAPGSGIESVMARVPLAMPAPSMRPARSRPGPGVVGCVP